MCLLVYNTRHHIKKNVLVKKNLYIRGIWHYYFVLITKIMKIDFYVSVIDNYGDMWFALNLADTLFYHDDSLEVRFFSDDKKLFEKMSKWLNTKYIEFFDLSEIKKHTPSSHIFNFFDRKLDSKFLSQFSFPINIITFSYFLLHTSSWLYSPSIETLQGKTYSFWPKNNITVKYCIPSLLPNTGWVVINPNTLKKREEYNHSSTKNRKHFLEKYWISLKNELFDKKWVSLFLYKETFENIKKNKMFESPDFVFFTFSDDLPNKKNIIKLPFLSLHDYGFFLSLCDMNFVRWENSLVEAILAWKPFIWDIYKEFNNAHREKIVDFADFLKEFHFSSEYFLDLEWFNIGNKSDFFTQSIEHMNIKIQWFELLSNYVRDNCNLYKIIKKAPQ